MSSPLDQEAFDEFLELALRGEAPPVERFLASRGAVEAEEAAAIRGLERLRQPHAPSGQVGSLPFESLGEFVLRSRLGHGGQGLVFLAEQRSLGRRVALKILRPELADSEEALKRLEREARVLAALRHPNIVAVHAFGEDRGVRYLAMDHLPGPTLEDLLREDASAPILLTRKVRWCAELARALECAHRSGVLHRDVKPTNVRFDAEGRPVLLDFGLARHEQGDATLTRGFAGSPHYASPEQLRGDRELDVRSDVYSLGVVLYRAVTRRLPFQAARTDALVARILAGDPPSPRTLAPALPRDLESVVLRAIEVDPRRRYPTAAELADDLEAVLELRAVRARPLSRIERIRRAARRRPGWAAAVATAAVALVAFGGLAIGRAALERSRRRAEHARLVEEARGQIGTYRESLAALAADTDAVEEIRRSQQYRFLTPREVADLDQSEARVSRQGRAWEAAFYAALDLLERAESFDGDRADIAELRGALYAERARQALAERDSDAADLYRALAIAQDPRGSRALELSRPCRVTLRTEPAGATVQLFRLEELRRLRPDGEARRAPVAASGRFAELAGCWALEVPAARGALLPGDLVLAVDGNLVDASLFVARAGSPLRFLDRLVSVDEEPAAEFGELRSPLAVAGETHRFRFERGNDAAAIEIRATSLSAANIEIATIWEICECVDRPPLAVRVWRDGTVRELVLDAATPVRPTATPLFATDDDIAGRTPLVGLELARGAWLARIRAPGCEELCVPIHSEGALELELELTLDPVGTTPLGFVRVESDAGGYGVAADEPFAPFWIQEREVTAAEYLEFLNDPRTLAEIDASSEPVRFPRSATNATRGGYWQRGADGRFVLPSPWRDAHPVLGVSWYDARAYAEWKSERSRELGRSIEYALPTEFEYGRATGIRPFEYPWGESFRAHFARTCFAQRRAAPGPVRMHPIDRALCGAYDLAGGAFEWLDAWYDLGRGLRWQGGGSWARSDPGMLRLAGGIGSAPETADNEEGLRLVIRSLEPAGNQER